MRFGSKSFWSLQLNRAFVRFLSSVIPSAVEGSLTSQSVAVASPLAALTNGRTGQRFLDFALRAPLEMTMEEDAARRALYQQFWCV
jgi:hypothetical protein